MSSKAADPVSPTRKATESVVAALNQVRGDIRDAKARRGEIEGCFVAVEIAQQRLADFCDRLSHEARERFAPQRFMSPAFQPPLLADVHCIMAGALADDIQQKVAAQIARAYGKTHGLTDDERTERIAAIDADVLRLELSEEAIIREAEASGFDILRRANADPRAVLAPSEALSWA